MNICGSCGVLLTFIPNIVSKDYQVHPSEFFFLSWTGTFAEELRRSFLGGGPQLLSTEFIHSGLERYRLRTIPSGTVSSYHKKIASSFIK